VSDGLDSTLRAARQRYFERNGFGADGGYDARWVKVALGPVTAAFPSNMVTASKGFPWTTGLITISQPGLNQSLRKYSMALLPITLDSSLPFL